MIRHFLRGIAAKDRNVRFRCVQFIANIVNTLQEIEDDLYEDLKYNLSKRLYDKEPNVRYYAALALTKMQDDPNDVDNESFSVTSLLIQSLQHDSSAEVRRTILLNLSKTSATRRAVLERAMDTNAINRRFVYSRVMEEIGDFRQLSIHHREKLLQWGLKDRDVGVRTAATKMFLEQWLKSSDNNIQEFLERLDVINSSIAETAMRVFFANRKDAVDAFDFTDELWQSLTPETVFLIRTFNDYCIKERLTLKLEEKLPELTKLGFFIELYINRLDKDPENIDLQFIAEQLLIIAETYDYADEVGRRKILATLREFATNKSLSDSVISKFVPIIRKLSVKESDFSQVIVELISDIKDQCEEELEKLEPDSDDRVFVENTCIIRCLVLAQSMLEQIVKPLESNQYLSAFLDTLIVPSIRSHYAEVREHGLKCLGLCCLVSKKLASENLLLLARCYTQGDEQLKNLSLKAITDILMIHGRDVFNSEYSDVNENTMYKLYCRALQNGEESELQSLAAVSLCKLLLNGIFDEPELMKACVLEYFGFDSCYNTKMRQTLNYCIPVFCYSSADKQKIMASIAVDSLRKLSEMYENLEEADDMLSPTVIMQQIIDWTDPARVVTAVNGELQQGAGYESVHCDLAADMLERIQNTYSKNERKALCLCLTRLKITAKVGVQALEDLQATIKDLINENVVTESGSKNSVTRFLKEIENLLRKAKQAEGVKKEGDGQELPSHRDSKALEDVTEKEADAESKEEEVPADEEMNEDDKNENEEEEDGDNDDAPEHVDQNEDTVVDIEMEEGTPFPKEKQKERRKPVSKSNHSKSDTTEKPKKAFDLSDYEDDAETNELLGISAPTPRRRARPASTPKPTKGAAKNKDKSPKKRKAARSKREEWDDSADEDSIELSDDGDASVRIELKNEDEAEFVPKTRARRQAVKPPVVEESESESSEEEDSDDDESGEEEEEEGSDDGSDEGSKNGSDDEPEAESDDDKSE